jgi:predicted RNA binding protein YcfA (HicA-like mRNA interferase family)
MPKLPVLRAREVISRLEKLGFAVVRQKGSHVQMKNGNLLVTIPVHSGTIAKGTLKSILRQARINAEELL